MTTIQSYWNTKFPDIDELSSTTFELFPDLLSSSSKIEPDHVQISTSTNYSSNMICSVCGAPASGYNFDQITCESCKAFFRRNALRDTSLLRCRFSSSCVIDMRTRRRCTYCRLKKCFDIKMRKDWIRTDEEKQLRQIQKFAKEQRKLNKSADQTVLNLPLVVRKKKRLTMKHLISSPIINLILTESYFSRNHQLSDDDLTRLNNITNAYKSIDNQPDNLHSQTWIPPATLCEFINEQTFIHQSLINFYKLIPEFNQLDLKDRILLIKLNLIKIIHLHCILINKFEELPMIGVCMTNWIGADFHQRMVNANQSFQRFKEYPLILKLALIILIFTFNLSAPVYLNFLDDYQNRKDIYRIQEFYTTILWKYLHTLYDENQVIISMDIIMRQILHYQELMTIMEEYIRNQHDVHTINELELSLFRLTI